MEEPPVIADDEQPRIGHSRLSQRESDFGQVTWDVEDAHRREGTAWIEHCTDWELAAIGRTEGKAGFFTG